MSDEVDLANANYDLLQDVKLQQIRAQAAAIPAGEPGECESCGLESKRLVKGLCAPCRDDFERWRKNR